MSNIALLSYKETLAVLADKITKFYLNGGDRRPSQDLVIMLSEIFDLSPLEVDTDIDTAFRIALSDHYNRVTITTT